MESISVSKGNATPNLKRVEEFADLPSFCRPVPAPDDPLLAIGIDFWAVESSGNDKVDEDRGVRYADEAISYARRMNQPEFVDCVLLWITCGLFNRYGSFPLDALTQAFIRQVLRDDPAVVDRIATRVFAFYPHLRN